MQQDSRSSSNSSPVPAEAGDDSDYYALPNDSQTSLVDGAAPGDGKGGGIASLPSAITPLGVEIDFEQTPVHLLPNEILMCIFGKLDSPKDLYTCMRVCKRWARHSVDMLWHRPACTDVQNLAIICQVLNHDYPFFSYRHFVRRLNLSNLASAINDGSLVPLAVCTRLERLTLANCENISDYGLVRMVENSPYLLTLDVSFATNLTGVAIEAIATNCPRLQGLNVTSCTNITNESLVQLARSCKYIKRSKLNQCRQVTNKTIIAFAENCFNILEIDLHGCVGISNAPITALLAHSQSLRELRLALCDAIDDDAFLHLPPNKTYGHLRILDLTNCALITDAAVQKIISVAPRLRNLVLNKCRNLTDVAVYAISRLGKNLHYLHLGHCSNITDDGLQKLVQECNRIRYIDLAVCPHLTDESIKQLAGLPKLKRIGLVKCIKITDECVKALAKRKQRDHYSSSVSSLERVHLSYCANLSLTSIYILLNSCPKLTHLSLTGVQAFQNEDFVPYCRPPPDDEEFNQHQRDVFCVFSGNGVSRFRDFLNSHPRYDYLKDAFLKHQRQQIPEWSNEPPYAGGMLTRHNFVRPSMVTRPRDAITLPMRPTMPMGLIPGGHPGSAYYRPAPESGYGLSDTTQTMNGGNVTAHHLGIDGRGVHANQTTDVELTAAPLAGPSSFGPLWLQQWAAGSGNATLTHRPSLQETLSSSDRVGSSLSPGPTRRERASTATGVVRAGSGSMDIEEPQPSGSGASMAPLLGGPDDDVNEDMQDDEDDSRGGGAHL